MDGVQTVIGGTSAVAPMWAALSAILSQALGKNVGFLNDKLYTLPAGCFRDVTSGNNGTYVARAGYDNCTGNGVPNAAKIFAALKALVAPAPTPTPVPTPTPATTHTIVVTGASHITLDGKEIPTT